MNNTVANDTALTVNFHGQDLFIIEHNGQPYTPMKTIVENMGLAWQPQLAKLNANPQRWGITKIVIPTLGNLQEAVCMPLRKLFGWLSTISPNKVKPELRETIIFYQNECDDVLWEHWTKNQPKPYGLVDPTPVTKTQYGILSAIIADIATSSGKEGTTKVALWSRFSNHFNLGSAKDLPAIKFDEAKAYLENLKAEYERGFTLAVVKKDDLLALGYDSETKMFAVKALEQPVKALPAPQPVMEIPNNMAMISITKLAELEKFSVTNERYFRQLPPKRTNVKEMLECLDVGMNLITDALDYLVFEKKDIDRAVDKILKGLLAMRRYQPKHMQADYCG